MNRFLAGLVLSLAASVSFAQSTITFDVQFNRVLQASGAFLPALYDSVNDPLGFGATSPVPNLTGTVTLTAVASGTALTNAGPNTVVLNGSWTDTWPGASPSDGWATHTYDNATFDLYQNGGKFANDFLSSPGGIFIGSDINGLLSDHGPASLYGGTCPYPNNIFGTLNCASANPAIMFEDNMLVFGASAVYPGLADLGQHDLISGTYNNSNPSSGIGHDNGLDGFYFEGELCVGDLSPCGNQFIKPGGIVRIVMTSNTGNTMFVVEGTVVPVPAAVWLFGSALGLLGWVRRRATMA